MRISSGFCWLRAWFLIGVLSTTARAADDFAPADIGISGGSTLAEADRVQLTARGMDIGGANDQCHFYYRTASGDFDVRVRLVSLGGGDFWAKAGLMARQELSPGCPAVSVVATPSLLGALMVSRLTSGGVAAAQGTSVAAFPPLWLRLQRTNGVFNGFWGVDGRRWFYLNSMVFPDNQPVLLGLAASSHATDLFVKAVFTDFSEVVSPAGLGLQGQLRAESPGPSSRKTGLAITEIMYHPVPRSDGKNLEFVELLNSNPFFEDISGYRLSGDIDYSFPPGTVLPGGGFVIVAKAPADFQSVHGLPRVLGSYDKNLKPRGVLRLRNRADAVLLEIAYSNEPPWPMAADGTGHSLVLARPSFGEASPEAWDASLLKGGSPGWPDSPRVGGGHAVSLNEYHGGNGASDPGYLELCNLASESVDLSGGWLSDDPATNKFRIPVATTIPAHGFAVFAEPQLGFSLTAAGATIYFSNPEQDQVIQAIRFGAHLLGTSVGCFPEGSGELYPLASLSPGAVNSAPQAAAVVLNEIMYDPISGNDDDQYLELFNRSSDSVDVGGWRFTDGIDFTFRAGTVIGPGGYLVVARNAVRLSGSYSNLTEANLVGDFQGKLAHGGERLALARPVTLADPKTGLSTTAYAVVDEVTYRAGGRWGRWAKGGGSSLELIDPRADRRLAANWADSDETRKAPWTTVEHSGQAYFSYVNPDSLQVLLLGPGECLVDDVEVLVEGVAGNLVNNPGLEKGLTSWVVLGDHVRSHLETNEAYQSAQSLHLVASNNGDTGANRVRVQIANGARIQMGKQTTIRAKVRWLHGMPEILLRLKGNALEAYGRLEVPRNLGTPGAPNSRAVANAGPAMHDVTPFPAVPAVNQPVTVTARIGDPDGIATAVLHYRLDPATTYTNVPMVDDGTEGDAVAGDGVYTAVIPGQSAGKLAAFYFEATDRHSPAASALFPDNAPQRECLVRWGEPALHTGFGTYRMWLTAATVAKWVARPVLSNEELDVTFVYGDQRVVYNASARYSGSPFHQSYSSPVGSICTYAMSVPEDDQVLGATSFNKLHAPGNNPGDDSTIQCEQTAYWMVRQLGLPWNYQRYIHVYVNGIRRGTLMEDTQVPGTDVLDANFPDDPNGQLFKCNGYQEYSDASSGAMPRQFITWCTLNQSYTMDGQPNLADYRWVWSPRAVRGAANDFTNIVTLLGTVNSGSGSDYQANVEGLIDVEQWLRTFAIEHVVGNWDSLGHQNGQNMYAYKPTNGKWRLLIWDFNIVLGNSGSNPANGNDLFQFNGGDTGLQRLYYYPAFMRAYLRNVKEIAEGPMMSATLIGALVDARYAAFRAGGLSVAVPTSIKSYVNNRRNTLLNTILPRYNAPFRLLGDTATDFTTNQNWFLLTGSAPLDVQSISVNGVGYPVTWVSVTNWTVRLPLTAAENNLIVRGLDKRGAPVPGAGAALSVTYTGPTEPPEGQVVINEIMYHPAPGGAEFIELFNTSARAAFNLSKYRLSGVDFTFGDGVWIDPGGYIVLAHSRSAFSAAYGSEIPIAGEYAGHLNNEGGTVQLIRPGPTRLADKVIDEAAYSSQFPWPQAANGQGGSLQLLDPASDPMNPSSWGAALPDAPGGDRWRFVSLTGTASSSTANLLVYHSPYEPPRDYLDISGAWTGTIYFPGQPFAMSVSFEKSNNAWAGRFVVGADSVPLDKIEVSPQAVQFAFPAQYGDVRWTGVLSPDGNTITGSFYEVYQVTNSITADFSLRHLNQGGRVDGGDLFLDDLQLVPGAVAGVGTNLIRDGDFEASLAGNWQIASNHAGTALSTTNTHSGQHSLHLVASSGGKDEATAVWQPMDSLTAGQIYTLSFWYLPSTNGLDLTVRLGDSPLATTQRVLPAKAATPGAPNAIERVEGALLPLALTEVLPENVDSITDALGHHAAWVELRNTSTNLVRLDGCFLTSQTNDLQRWAFPAGTTMEPGELRLIWLDGASDESTATEWHANFLASPRDGMIILSHNANGTLTVLDTLAYQALPAGRSFGVLPGGQRAVLTVPTPALPNPGPPAVVHLRVNEWMAGNTRTMADPSDGRFKDWFELRNLDDQAADLAGYSLTDSISGPRKFIIPAGTSISERGYLLVWADDQASPNSTNPVSLHVNFKLSQDGDTIALFAPDGTLVDSVSFGPQLPDISQGRDAQGALVFMDHPTPAGDNLFPEIPQEVLFRITDLIVEPKGTRMLGWASEPGRKYQVQYRDNLSQTSWSDLGQPLIASEGFATTVVDRTESGPGQRFYRVLRIP